MKFKTKYHGELEYSDKDIIIFKKGLPGFDGVEKFVLVPIQNNEFFKVLHSIEDSEVGFIVVSPFDVMKEYEFDLEDSIVKKLKIQDKKDIMVVNTVTMNSEVNKITVNMRAPIIINNEEKLAEQVILNNEKYLIKHPLIKEKG